MKFGSLFSGIEAASVAWGPLGWRCAWVAEIDPFASAVLAHRYPDVPNLGDVTRIDTDAIEPVDLIVFGSPCQSFSVAGKRIGLDDPRGNMALVGLSVVDRARPRWVVFENVPGLLSSDEWRDFGTFLGTLGQCGYGFAYRVLDAQYAGVPQRRRRVFVVGYLGDWRPPAAVLFEPESLRGDPPPRREAGQNAPAGAGDGSAFSAFGGNRQSGAIDVAAAVTAHGGSHGRLDFESETFVAPALRADGFDASEDGTGRGTPLIPILEVGKGSTSRGQGPNGAGFGADGDPMFTLQAGAQHAIGGMTVRRLTPLECERLQGLPDHWTAVPYRGKPAADGPRYRAIGNSMAVPVVRWIGERIQRFEDAAHSLSKGSAAA